MLQKLLDIDVDLYWIGLSTGDVWSDGSLVKYRPKFTVNPNTPTLCAELVTKEMKIRYGTCTAKK